MVIRLLVAIPVLLVRVLIWISGIFVDLKGSTWDNDVIEGLEFLEHSVLQVPFFLMSLMRFITPTLDEMFMQSLEWVDRTYIQKHQTDDPTKLRAMYYPNMKLYQKNKRDPNDSDRKKTMERVIEFLVHSARRAGLSIAIYLLSFTPYVGRFVLPAASFYTFNQAVGTQPAVVIFATGIFLPRRYLVTFLQSYFASRSLMRQLLDPYFSRIHFTKDQKRQWFKDREGVLFGFGVGFFLFLKIPLVGVLIYGIAEASTAYLITKITDPPPPPAEVEEFTQSQIRWQNKHEFLSLPLAALDVINTSEKPAKNETKKEYPTKTYS